MGQAFSRGGVSKVNTLCIERLTDSFGFLKILTFPGQCNLQLFLWGFHAFWSWKGSVLVIPLSSLKTRPIGGKRRSVTWSRWIFLRLLPAACSWFLCCDWLNYSSSSALVVQSIQY